MSDNPMRIILVEKVTVNIGTGQPGEALDNAKGLLQRLCGGRKPIETNARRREPAFKLRKGLAIGTAVTLRGSEAESFIVKALAAKRKTIKSGNFDREGNFSFGVAEYIDFPGAKYDPAIGMYGFDVCVTLKRPGKRVAKRRLRKSRIGKKHRISKEEAIEFVKTRFGAKIE
ncbi:50S ribosomal protein L5 [Candidatus Micrarchaeota archaeon]|nr:50S ribosomal protein L5 [Candidatus Micrarchaeota archaeon]